MAYQIIHKYDVDGGFGDAVTKEYTLGLVETEEEAKAFCEKYGKDEVYDKPYAYLHCHVLTYKKATLLDTSKDPFENDWLTEQVLRFNNRCIHIINIQWDENDEYYEDIFETTEYNVPVKNESEIGEWLEHNICKAISWEIERK